MGGQNQTQPAKGSLKNRINIGPNGMCDPKDETDDDDNVNLFVTDEISAQSGTRKKLKVIIITI